MRTLLVLILLLLYAGCRAQHSYDSFGQQLYQYGQDPVYIQKIVHLFIEKDSIAVQAGNKTTSWIIYYQSEKTDEEITIDTYASKTVSGELVLVKLLYRRGELLDVVFTKNLCSLHFYITYPKHV